MSLCFDSFSLCRGVSTLLVVLEVEFGVDVMGVIVVAPIVTADVLLILFTADIIERCFLLGVLLLFEFSSISSTFRFCNLLSLIFSTCLSICFSCFYKINYINDASYTVINKEKIYHYTFILFDSSFFSGLDVALVLLSPPFFVACLYNL